MDANARKKKEEEIRNAKKIAQELKGKMDENNFLIISLALDNGKSKEYLLEKGLKEEDIDKVINSRSIEKVKQTDTIPEKTKRDPVIKAPKTVSNKEKKNTTPEPVVKTVKPEKINKDEVALLKKIEDELKKNKDAMEENKAGIIALAVSSGKSKSELEKMGLSPKDVDKIIEERNKKAEEEEKEIKKPGVIEPEATVESKVVEPEPVAEKVKEVIENLKSDMDAKLASYLKQCSENRKINNLRKNIAGVLAFVSRGSLKTEFIKSKENYDKARLAYGNQVYLDKKAELEKDPHTTLEQMKTELGNLKAGLCKEIVAEGNSILLGARASEFDEKKASAWENAMVNTIIPKGEKAWAGIQTGLRAWKKLGDRGHAWRLRGRKPENAVDIIKDADAKLLQVADIRKLALAETDPTKKKTMLQQADELEKEANTEKDIAVKGKIIYEYRAGQLVRNASLFAVGGVLIGGGLAGLATVGTAAALTGFAIKTARGIVIGFGGAIALAKTEASVQKKLDKQQVAREQLELSTKNSGEDLISYQNKLDEIKSNENKIKRKGGLIKASIITLMAGGNLAGGSGKIGFGKLGTLDTHLGFNLDKSIESGIHNMFDGSSDTVPTPIEATTDTAQAVKPIINTDSATVDTTQAVKPIIHADSTTTDTVAKTPVVTPVAPAHTDPTVIKTPEPVVPQAPGKTIELKVSSRGFIQTAEDLKATYKTMYEGVPDNKIPDYAKHVLETNANKIAQEWETYRPKEDTLSGGTHKESGRVLAGDTKGVVLGKNNEIIKGMDKDVSKIIINKETGQVTLHSYGEEDIILVGQDATKFKGEMFDSNNGAGSATKLTEGGKVDIEKIPGERLPSSIDIDKIPDQDMDRGVSTDGLIDIPTSNSTPEEILKFMHDHPNTVVRNPETGLPYSKSDLFGKTSPEYIVKSGTEIKIGDSAYAGKSVVMGSDHKIYVDGKFSDNLTERFQLERTKAIEKIDSKFFSWTSNAEKSSEWANIHNKDIKILSDKNSDIHKSFKGDEEKYIKKLLRNAERANINTKAFQGTADQLIEEIALKKLG
ncbi:hypothetical protein IT400_04525 [Candidatus Nomurabacteria bacterium]|nr:hypothetical protein [Candidatus Nomurabacteria bacterium]